MDDDLQVEEGDEQDAGEDIATHVPDDPTAATNDSNVGTVAGLTGPTPLTGAQIVSSTTDDPDPEI
jgi:hypothetical protein